MREKGTRGRDRNRAGPPAQLALFGAPAPAQPGDDALVALAQAIPRHVHLGTSSWTFPGWRGLVYRGHYASQREFTRDALSEYARHPLFSTVGIDRSHYAPLTREELRHYATQLPTGFRCVAKVWDAITTMVYPDHPRYGAQRGGRNPTFLDVARFRDEVAAPMQEEFGAHLAALVLEVPPMRSAPEPREFERALERFLHEAPFGLHYAVELRNRELLTPRYFDILRHHGASHVLNFWSLMPSLREQLALPGVMPGPVVIARLMLPPFQRYESRRADMAPFDRLLDPQHAMREDVLTLADRAEELGLEVYVIVNNKVEGSSPLTVKALAELWAARGAR